MIRKTKQTLTKIEKDINFSIIGKNENGIFELIVSSFFQLTRCPETDIVVVRVTQGKDVMLGTSLAIVFENGNMIVDNIQNLQIGKKDAAKTRGRKSTGIKLGKINFEELKTLNDAVKVACK